MMKNSSLVARGEESGEDVTTIRRAGGIWGGSDTTVLHPYFGGGGSNLYMH